MNDFSQERPFFSGAYAIVMTPFLKSDKVVKVDYDELCRQVDRVCESEITGIVACGSTGEFTSLSEEENLEMMRQITRTAAGRKRIVCGATAADVQGSLRYLEGAARCGADGALVAPPYYFPLDDEDVLDFYRELDRGGPGVPIIAYQIPLFTSPVSLRVYRELLECGRICGIKNSSGNFNQMIQQIDLRNRLRPGFSVSTGSDESIFAALSVGGDGNMTALTYLFPELVSFLYREFGRSARALECQMDLLELVRLAGEAPFPMGYKMLGEAAGRFRFGENRRAVSAERMARFAALFSRMEGAARKVREKYPQTKERHSRPA